MGYSYIWVCVFRMRAHNLTTHRKDTSSFSTCYVFQLGKHAHTNNKQGNSLKEQRKIVHKDWFLKSFFPFFQLKDCCKITVQNNLLSIVVTWSTKYFSIYCILVLTFTHVLRSQHSSIVVIIFPFIFAQINSFSLSILPSRFFHALWEWIGFIHLSENLSRNSL